MISHIESVNSLTNGTPMAKFKKPYAQLPG